MLPSMPTTPAEAMRFDPLQAAEEATGKSYKSDELTEKLGMALHLAHVQNTRQIMTAAGDSHFGMNAIQFQELLLSNGFVHLGSELVASSRCWLYWNAYWRTPGQLLFCDYMHWHAAAEQTRMTVNSATCYYNWRPHDADAGTYADALSSGHFHHDGDCQRPLTTPWTWIGDHDAREGIITALNRMAACGEFIEPWVEPPFLHATVGQYEKPEQGERSNYGVITVNRLRKQLPVHIQELILLDDYEARHVTRRLP